MITYDRKLNRFRKSNGEFVERGDVAKKIDTLTENVGRKMEKHGKDLVEGKINLPEFQIRMKDEIKSAHIVSASVARGGHKQMTAKDWGKLGSDLKFQYQRLNAFARDIADNRQSQAQILSRAKQYSYAVRNAYTNKQKEVEKGIGKAECRRVPHSLENCIGCASWVSRGWVLIDEQPPIGSLNCKSSDRCTLEYR